MGKRKWADRYGSRWYLHFDGTPPHDDDNDYEWTGTQWALLVDDDEDSAPTMAKETENEH